MATLACAFHVSHCRFVFGVVKKERAQGAVWHEASYMCKMR